MTGKSSKRTRARPNRGGFHGPTRGPTRRPTGGPTRRPTGGPTGRAILRPS
ncbi:PT domain-containing protein [Streptomyces sp. NPDC096013]|uniref:PT domain-containing protein n=1 Tax=Streptomyces sp. NPDC096013 TaxID=3366069 RepID=UPI003806D238